MRSVVQFESGIDIDSIPDISIVGNAGCRQWIVSPQGSSVDDGVEEEAVVAVGLSEKVSQSAKGEPSGPATNRESGQSEAATNRERRRLGNLLALLLNYPQKKILLSLWRLRLRIPSLILILVVQAGSVKEEPVSLVPVVGPTDPNFWRDPFLVSGSSPEPMSEDPIVPSSKAGGTPRVIPIEANAEGSVHVRPRPSSEDRVSWEAVGQDFTSTGVEVDLLS
ncbi:hypothetical protein LWI29_012930 [Acer saccharum]|uniref:Uncharacterized protein n=1 Tax=Acer saccharum TaxID=4024 RepID=A0AA39S2X5_ACESA|nr:hypothetical protein LWI29_012930 [Acer saccharum]